MYLITPDVSLLNIPTKNAWLLILILIELKRWNRPNLILKPFFKWFLFQFYLQISNNLSCNSSFEHI